MDGELGLGRAPLDGRCRRPRRRATAAPRPRQPPAATGSAPSGTLGLGRLDSSSPSSSAAASSAPRARPRSRRPRRRRSRLERAGPRLRAPRRPPWRPRGRPSRSRPVVPPQARPAPRASSSTGVGDASGAPSGRSVIRGCHSWRASRHRARRGRQCTQAASRRRRSGIADRRHEGSPARPANIVTRPKNGDDRRSRRRPGREDRRRRAIAIVIEPKTSANRRLTTRPIRSGGVRSWKRVWLGMTKTMLATPCPNGSPIATPDIVGEREQGDAAAPTRRSRR